jgi:hypothetical protein
MITTHSPTYLLNLLSHLSTGLRLIHPLSPADGQALKDTRDSLSRLLPFHIPRQAVPATPADVQALEQAEPSGRGLLIRLLWQSAARFSDWEKVTGLDVQWLGRGWVRARYRRTKTSVRGIVRLIQFRLPPQAHSALLSRLSTAKASRLFHYSYATTLSWLKRLRPHLSLHSFRRGAVQRMLDADVPPREVARLTGHKSLTTLFGYAHRLPPSAKRAMALAYHALI